jgi:hypothetical protein
VTSTMSPSTTTTTRREGARDPLITGTQTTTRRICLHRARTAVLSATSARRRLQPRTSNAGPRPDLVVAGDDCNARYDERRERMGCGVVER